MKRRHLYEQKSVRIDCLLLTGNRLATKGPQLGGGVDASIVSKEAEQEFDELYKRVVSVVVGERP